MWDRKLYIMGYLLNPEEASFGRYLTMMSRHKFELSMAFEENQTSEFSFIKN